MKNEMTQKKDMVEYCLLNYPETRNSDVRLRQFVIREYYSKYIKRIDGQEAILFRDEYEVINQDTVKRHRAQFNEKGQFLPTEWKIAKQRRINEKVWQEAMGYVPYNPVRQEDQSRLI